MRNSESQGWSRPILPSGSRLTIHSTRLCPAGANRHGKARRDPPPHHARQVSCLLDLPQCSTLTLNPKPQTRHPKPESLNPEPQTSNPQPQTLKPQPQIPNLKPQTPNPTPQTPNLKSQTASPKPQTLNPEPQNPNPHPQILNPTPGDAHLLRSKNDRRILLRGVISRPARRPRTNRRKQTQRIPSRGRVRRAGQPSNINPQL